MRILHRMAKQDRERKGPGLAPHIPMPGSATGTAAELHPGLSDADLELLELAAAKMPLLGPAAVSRGRELADIMRQRNPGLDDAALRDRMLVHLHWMTEAYEQKVFPAVTWGAAIDAVMAACHELHTRASAPGPSPWADGCGCQWLMPQVPGGDPAWVPCDGHGQPLRAVQDGGSGE